MQVQKRMEPTALAIACLYKHMQASVLERPLQDHISVTMTIVTGNKPHRDLMHSAGFLQWERSCTSMGSYHQPLRKSLRILLAVKGT